MTARGGIVDENALVDAVASGRLRGLPWTSSRTSRPRQTTRFVRPGIVLTSRAAWCSQEAIADLRQEAIADLRQKPIETALAFARGVRPAGLVNA